MMTEQEIKEVYIELIFDALARISSRVQDAYVEKQMDFISECLVCLMLHGETYCDNTTQLASS